MPTRTHNLQIYGRIDAEMAEDVREQLNQIPESEGLEIALASPGGSVGEGFKMYQWLNRYKSVEVNIEGDCFSAATLIACAGDHVNMADTAMFMIHRPYTAMMGNFDDLRKTADAMQKLEKNVVKTYHRKTRKAEGLLSDMMAAETYLDAEEALSENFVDNITGSGKHQMFAKQDYACPGLDEAKLVKMLGHRPGFSGRDPEELRAKKKRWSNQ